MARRYKAAFTLIEVIIAFIIVAVLVMIGIPRYNQALVKSRAMARAVPTLNLLREAQRTYYTKVDQRYDIPVGNNDTVLWDPIGVDVPNNAQYNYGVVISTGTAVIDQLGGPPGIVAVPTACVGPQAGTDACYQVGLTMSGRLGKLNRNNRLDEW